MPICARGSVFSASFLMACWRSHLDKNGIQVVLKAILLCAISLWTLGIAQAEIVRPWETGQDLELFYNEHCSASNLEAHYFSGLTEEHLGTLTKLISEVLWTDVSDYMLNVKGSSTKAVVGKLRALKHSVSPGFTAIAQEAAHDPMHTKYVHLHNRNLKQRDYVLDRFKALAISDPRLAGAMITYLDCRIIRNVKTLDPFVANRVDQVKSMKLNIQVIPSSPASSPSGRPAHYDSGCSCAGGNVCYGPRGGRYCITSGGNKRYGI